MVGAQQVATKVPIMSVLKWIPKLFAIIYALIIIGSSFSVAVREGDMKIFLIDGFGTVITGADNQLYKNTIDMKEKAVIGQSSILDMLNVLSPFLLLYYVLKSLMWFFNKVFSKVESELPKYIVSITILFLVQTLVYSIAEGKFVMGFSGLITFFLNLDVFFAPIYPTGIYLGNASINSPIV